MPRGDCDLSIIRAVWFVTITVTLNPPYEEWGSILASNRSVASELHRVLGSDFVAELRRQVIEVAARYRSEMRESARRLGIAWSDVETGASRGIGSVVMAGHQPVVYHPGILEKTTRLASFAAATGSYALNVAIDTDEGDGGRLLWPLRDHDDIVIKEGTIAGEAALYRDQRVVSQDQSAALFAELKRDLATSGCARSVVGAEKAERLYGALAGEPIVLANSIVRKSLAGGAYDEVPLSLLLEASNVREFIERIARDAERFAALYNETLERYRADHKIRNPANPFPNMKVTADEIELPLWYIEGDSRKGVFVGRPGALRSTNLIAPRGSIVTLLLRGVCSDLFIHGIGGGKYDQFVNGFAEAYWGAPMPRFVVASATAYLFPERLQEYRNAREVKATFKEMVSHTADFIGRGLFSPDDESVLAPLIERRRALLPRMQVVQSKEERSVIAHELNEVNRLIKGAIDRGSLSPLLAQGEIDEARLNRWACREYPFFLF